MQFPVVYLANNLLRRMEENGAATTIESKFGNDLIARSLREQQRNSWKSSGNDGKFLTGAALWGKGEADEGLQIQLTSLCKGKNPGEFFYTLRTQHSSAILWVTGHGAEEQRIWNNNMKRVSHLAVHPQLGHIVCSVEHKMGTANIGIRLSEDSGVGEVTEGDSIDTAPCWVPGEEMMVVFQSAGIGRNKEGLVGGIGPFSIQRLVVDSGELETMAEDSNFDFLNPRVGADGSLYYIKRPYEGNRSASILDMLKDTVLFPFRLARALFGFLNFFSMMYSGKQLKTVKARDAKNADIPQMMIYGNLIKAQQGEEGEAQAVAPRSWKLIKQQPGKTEQIIADGVLCFDLGGDGSLVYSDGSRIFGVDAEGAKRQLGKDTMVQQVAAMKLA